MKNNTKAWIITLSGPLLIGGTYIIGVIYPGYELMFIKGLVTIIGLALLWLIKNMIESILE